MELFIGALLLATLLCSLVAGFLFSFAVVVMPGIATLNDREFLRAFQAMDRVIQNRQVIFLAIWVGSIIALTTATLLGIGRLGGVDDCLLILGALIYMFGVQLPTIAINVPLNNRIQCLDIRAMAESEHKVARDIFESRWNRWNCIRAALSSLVSMLLISLVFKL